MRREDFWPVWRQDPFLDQIKGKQFTDEKLIRIRDKVLRGEAKEVKIDEEGVLRIKGRLCVPRIDDLIHTILIEAHSSRYSNILVQPRCIVT